MKQLSNTFIYLSSTLIKKGIPFLLLPIMTSYLSPSEYGEVSLFLALSGFILPFISLNLLLEITRIYQNSDETSDTLATKLYTLISIPVILSFSAIVLFSLFFLVRPISVNNSKLLFIFNPLYTLFVFISSVPTTILRNRERPIAYGIVENGTSLLIVLLSLFMVIIMKAGSNGRIFSVIFTYTLTALISIVYLFKTGAVKAQFQSEYFFFLFRRYLPMVFYSLSGIILSVSDRFFIQKMLGSNSLGIYSVAYNFGVVLAILNDSVSKAVTPQMYRWGNNLNLENSRRIVRFSHLYMFAFITIGLLASIVFPILLKLFVNERYHSGASVIIWVIWGYIFNGFYKNTFIFYVAKNTMGILSLILSIAAVSNLFLNYFLIQLNGISGAAQATCISYFISYVVSVIYTSVVYKVRWFSFTTINKKESI